MKFEIKTGLVAAVCGVTPLMSMEYGGALVLLLMSASLHMALLALLRSGQSGDYTSLLAVGLGATTTGTLVALVARLDAAFWQQLLLGLPIAFLVGILHVRLMPTGVR